LNSPHYCERKDAERLLNIVNMLIKSACKLIIFVTIAKIIKYDIITPSLISVKPFEPSMVYSGDLLLVKLICFGGGELQIVYG